MCSYRGTYCGQDVAIKVLRPERTSIDIQKEFAQEVRILKYVSNECGYSHVLHMKYTAYGHSSRLKQQLIWVKEGYEISEGCPNNQTIL